MPREQRINTNTTLSRQDDRNLQRQVVDNGAVNGSGIACTVKVEPIPEYIPAECEKVISSANSYIVLGRDRPGSRLTGYGGVGAVGAHSIDLVVGRTAPGAPRDEKVYVDPSFVRDAARIYIAEKTDIDYNFRLVDGFNGSSVGRSAIGMKADAIRIIAEEDGIKLVTRSNSRNSNGRLISRSPGVELIAGNDDSGLQPMVKGDNLVELLEEIINQISDLNGIVIEMALAMNLFEVGLLTHIHPPGSPSPTLVPFSGQKFASNLQAIIKGTTQKINLATKNITYLSSVTKKGILSDYHRVN